MFGFDRQTKYERIARRHYGGIYNYLRWCCRDAELAADLTQETFLQVWRHLPDYRGEAPLKAWLYRVARNQYLQYRRRAGLTEVPLTDELEQTGSDYPTPQAGLEREAFSQAILAVVDNLPDSYREVIVLHNLEGLSLAEVAQVLGIPIGTVKSRRAKAFEMLRGLLAEVRCNEVRQSS